VTSGHLLILIVACGSDILGEVGLRRGAELGQVQVAGTAQSGTAIAPPGRREESAQLDVRVLAEGRLVALVTEVTARRQRVELLAALLTHTRHGPLGDPSPEGEPPTSGATMNSHTWLSAVPPTMRAGPRLRAGFTDVPVIGIPMRWTTVRVSPITMAAVAAFPSLLVTPRMTKTNSAVSRLRSRGFGRRSRATSHSHVAAS
jgi:hypothetical protein